MSLRIQRATNPIPALPSERDLGPAEARPVQPVSQEDPYWNQLLALIPTDATAIYVAGNTVIPKTELIALVAWALFGLVATMVLRLEQTRTHPQDPSIKLDRDWAHAIVSAGAFIVWVYALGGPFIELNIHVPWLASLLIIGYTFSAPRILPIVDRIVNSLKKKD